ncbi:methyl-accepting chemotaxis protein [Rhizobium herbae]
MLFALVALAGILVIAGIFLWQRQIEASFRLGVDRLTRHQQEVTHMDGDLRDTLLWEQQFLLAKDPAAIGKFQASHAAATAAVESLRGGAAPVLAADLDALKGGLELYAGGFSRLVKDNEALGLDPSSGFEGAMRGAVHSIEEQLKAVDDANIRASMLMLRRHEKDFILRRDPKYIEAHGQEGETFKGLVKKAFKPGVQRMRIMDAFEIYRDAFRLYAGASLKEAESRRLVAEAYGALEPVTQRVLASFSAEKTMIENESARIAERNISLVIGLLAVTVLVLLAGVWIIGRSISRPVKKVTEAMRDLAGGNTDVTVPGLGMRNEFGSMAEALEVFRQSALANRRLEEEAAEARVLAEEKRRQLQEDAEASAQLRLHRATAGLAGGLQRLAGGDLSFELIEPFSADFESLRENLNTTLRQLNGVMQDIAQSSTAIENGSREISGSAGDLARRTEQQAAALEQTAASLDEITANVTNSARRAQEARQAAVTANESAARTENLVTQAITAMERIEQSSERIASIIGVIDEIAFQTNLLALNAGIEAARAGDAGRGFAVVAQEVRGLAQRSAGAAGEIKQLIRTSVNEVLDGARFVRDTGAALTEIGDHVDTMSRHVEAIAVSSREQSTGLAEINAAVNQMDQGTQQNAAMVEENNAASVVLANEAARLRGLISVFQLAEKSAQADDTDHNVANLRRMAGQAA